MGEGLTKEEEYYLKKRSRAVCIVVREGKILMEKVFYFGRYFYTVPGGGIEAGETPEQAAIRELNEECGLTGTAGAGDSGEGTLGDGQADAVQRFNLFLTAAGIFT